MPAAAASALNAGGVATCNIPGNTLTGGSKSFTAEFAGGPSHLPSTSAPLAYTYVACTVNPVVANSNDSGAGSLRQAVADACPGSSITFNMGTVVSPIGLTSGTLTLGRNVTITGPGANVLTVQRTGGTFGIVTIQPGLTVTISGVTIAGGTATGSPNRGGGIYNNGSTLTLSAVALTGNSAGFGGALFNSAEVAAASVTIVNSTLNGNSASLGGAIDNQSAGAPALLTIRNTTISGNVALGNGGAIFNGGPASPMTITNGTIVNNRTDGAGTGGGLYLEPGSGAVVLQNTIVAGNVIGLGPATPDDVSGALDGSSAYSLVGTSAGMTGITHGVGGNLVGTPGSPIDPRVSALLSHGGPTLTHALVAGSPALDAGDNALAAAASLTTDQRGVARTADGPDADTIATVDLGAFEAGASLERLPIARSLKTAWRR